MKRAGFLLLAVVPVLITTAVYCALPEHPARADAGTSAPASRQATGRSGATAERGTDDRRAAAVPAGLAAPGKKELAQQLVASAENSTLDWREAYAYVEDIGDGQGYTAGVIGFCTGTHDLLTLVESYTRKHPDNGLARYLPALRRVDGSDSHEGLDPDFPAAWRHEATVPAFRAAQDAERDRVYFDPAVRQARRDGLGTLGQFIYYDAMVMHGPGTGDYGFYGLRDRALREAEPPSKGGDEEAYLDTFLDVRRAAMRSRDAHRDTTRIDTAQRVFLREGNLALDTPLVWKVYGETYRVP
ncbi:chitosanase [Streptomyces sp. NPDC060187]|uniref:chitosanase n=1 Tax=Streptomyces sp. NPDC060187 TaxID=3347067 RepID=UPI0036486B53